jgi:hypothetical protein
MDAGAQALDYIEIRSSRTQERTGHRLGRQRLTLVTVRSSGTSPRGVSVENPQQRPGGHGCSALEAKLGHSSSPAATDPLRSRS